MAQEAKPLAGVSDAFGGLADAELEGVAAGIDDQQGAGSNHGQEVAGCGVGRTAEIELADAAGGREIGVVGADATDRDDCGQAFIGRPGVKRLVATARGAGDRQPGGIDFRRETR